MIDDSVIAITAAISLFVLPSYSSHTIRDSNEGIERKRRGYDIDKKVESNTASTPEIRTIRDDEYDDDEEVRELNTKKARGRRRDDKGHQGILDWQSAVRIPWGVLLLIGGGIALASGFSTTGLNEWIAGQLGFLAEMHYLIIIFTIVAVTIFASEIVSNTATAALIIPISASLAISLGIPPFFLWRL